MNYKKIYNQLIAKRRNLPVNSNKLHPYEVEYHHIIPIKCDGENTPRNKKYNTIGTNLIGLTLREHYVAHKLLEKIYEGTQYGYSMTCALWNMSNTRNGLIVKTSSTYAKLKSRNSIATSALKRGKPSKAKDYIWITNGDTNKFVHKNTEIPLGYRRGMTKNYTEQSRNKAKQSKWINNGKVEKFLIVEELPHGFSYGRLEKTKLKCSQSSKGKKHPSTSISNKNRAGFIVVNNGIIDKQVKSTEIPEGFKIGSIKIKNAAKKSWSRLTPEERKQRVNTNIEKLKTTISTPEFKKKHSLATSIGTQIAYAKKTILNVLCLLIILDIDFV